MGIYKNVMEILVEEEVVRQVKLLSARIASYLNQVEIVAYALNQLPALYATSEKGLEHQLQQGREKYKHQITQSVHRAIAAVRRDPLRVCAPLLDRQSMPLREVLAQMRFLLKNDRLTWKNLPTAVEQALLRATQGALTKNSGYSSSKSSMHRQEIISTFSRRQEPKLPSFSDVSANNEDPFGWDNPLYHSH